jgi:hypothetical protein
MIRKILLALWLAAPAFPQEAPLPPLPPPVVVHPTFLQMSDPQFGMYTNNHGFAQETANFAFAIATANRLKPAFVVVTGDLINKPGDGAQAAEYKRIAAQLDPAIQLFNVPGNHDVENEPTPQSLARYRQLFGPDYYTFHCAGISGIVLDSNLEKAPQNARREAAKMEAWFEAEILKARREHAGRVMLFQHIPLFLTDPQEPDQYFNIPQAARARYLKLLRRYGVTEVFAGHLHHNSEGRDGPLDMVTTGPVGKPLGGQSGICYVTVTAAGVKHEFHEFGDLP